MVLSKSIVNIKMLEISKIVMFLIKKIYFLKNFFMIKETVLNMYKNERHKKFK